MTQIQGARARHTRVLSVAGVTVIGTLCGVYIISQFLRVSVGVIAPNLASEIGLSAVELGFLSSAFFVAFAGAQLPLGVAIDRFGPKRCMLFCAALMVLGSLVFAYGATARDLVLGRILLGFGTASFFMAPLAIYARWFAPEKFSTVTGIHLGIGSLGTLLATAPLAFAVAAVGWRATFVGVGGISVVAAFIVLALVRDDPPGALIERPRESVRESLVGIWKAMGAPSVGRLFALNLATYSSFLLVVGLWGGPYLTHHYGLDLKGRGEILFIPALTQIAGAFFWGPMDRVFRRHKAPVLIGAGSTALLLLALGFFGTLPMVALVTLLAAFGFTSAYMPVLIAHGRSLFPPPLIGRGITLLNMGSMAGVFLSQSVSGALIGLFPSVDGVYPLDAYRLVFALQGLLLAAACLLYSGARDPYARD